MPYLPEDNLNVNSDVGVILPTYCEAQNIERLIVEIEALPLNTIILVIGDSSPDGTAEAIRSIQKCYPTYFCSSGPKRAG